MFQIVEDYPRHLDLGASQIVDIIQIWMIDLWHTSTSTEESKCARRANRQKVILQAVVVTVTAIAVRFKEKHIDKSLVETMTL